MHGYIIVWEKTVMKLKEAVNDQLGNGYAPIGGVAYDGAGYLQAMSLQPEDE